MWGVPLRTTRGTGGRRVGAGPLAGTMTARPWMWTRGTPLHPTRTMAGVGRRGHMGVPVTHHPWAGGMTVGAGAGTGTGTGADGIGAGAPTTTDSGTTGAGVLWRAGTDLPCVWWTNESETRGTGGTGTETETGTGTAFESESACPLDAAAAAAALWGVAPAVALAT